MNFLAVSLVIDMSDVEMCSFCLLVSMELIHRPNCSSLLYLNYMNSLKILKNYKCEQTQIKISVNQLLFEILVKQSQLP